MAAFKTVENITTLINLLQRSSSGVPLQEICSRLELSERQIYRLKDRISLDLGIDIETKPDPDGVTNSKRWVIVNATVRAPLPRRLDNESWILLQLLLGHSRTFLSTERNKIVERLRDSIESSFIRDKKRHLKTTYIKFTGSRDYSEFDDIIATIGTCLRENIGASVTYRAQSTAQEKIYDIEPYTLVDHGGALYLICAVPKHDRHLIRLSVDRIATLVTNNKSFVIPSDYEPSDHLSGSFGITVEEPMRVVVRLFEEQAYYAINRIWGKDQQIVEENGSIVLSFTAAGKYEILRWILACGKDALVIEPPELVDLVREELDKAHRRYC